MRINCHSQFIIIAEREREKINLILLLLFFSI